VEEILNDMSNFVTRCLMIFGQGCESIQERMERKEKKNLKNEDPMSRFFL